VPDNDLICTTGVRHLSNKNLQASGPADLGPADPPTRNLTEILWE